MVEIGYKIYILIVVQVGNENIQVQCLLFIQECRFLQEGTVLVADKLEERLYCFQPQAVCSDISMSSIFCAREITKIALPLQIFRIIARTLAVTANIVILSSWQ